MNIPLFIIGILFIFIGLVDLFFCLKSDVDCDQEPELPDSEDEDNEN